MNRRVLALAWALNLVANPALLPSASAQVSTPSDAARAEARERFDRGLRLFNSGDNSGALAEFRRAYDLVANTVVLYNIGLVYAQTGRAVEATDALDRVLSRPGELSAERLAIARRTRDEQAARIANVAVAANDAGARVEVDGIEVGTTPLGAPLRITSGTHVVGLVAAGYSPQRKEIAIAGGEKQSLQFELVAMQGRMAHLAVKTHLPGADLYADDQHIGTSPLAASVSLSPGVHRIDLRRSGYTTAAATVTLGDGATGEVTLEPTEDPGALVSSGGILAFDVTETAPVVTIDGQPRGVYGAPVRVAAGPHHVMVERGDFIPAERDVSVDPGKTTTLRIVLEPTPETRTRVAQRVQTQRMWGWIGVVGGAAVAAGGVALVVYDAGQRSDANANAARLNAAIEPHSQSSCDPAAQDSSTPQYQQQCIDPINTAYGRVHDANTRDYFAWSAVGVGAASVVTGVVLLVMADDPHKYDRVALGPGSGFALHVVPTVWTARDGGGVVLQGAF
jgi:hypothetical protein